MSVFFVNYYMAGSGSIQFMISSYKGNRNLLKKKSTGKYQSFDTAYITDFPLSKKKKRTFSLPKADAIFMRTLRRKLQQDRDAVKRKNRAILATTAVIILALAVFLFSIQF